jgi:hypothetical protein
MVKKGDRGRPSSEVIGDLVQGGFGTGLPGDEGAGTGGLGGGLAPVLVKRVLELAQVSKVRGRDRAQRVWAGCRRRR